MVSQKRLTWLILSILVFTTGIMFVATRQTSGEANIQQTRQRTRTKILRRYDRLSLKPSGQEVQDNQAPPPEERFLENTIPNHVPIKIKIRKEKEKGFKDLRNEKWAREFELEVKNTGSKPIYSLSLLLVTDIRSNESGLPIVFPITFGRTELGDIRAIAEPTDIPIKPGETYVFQFHAGQVRAFEARNREQNRPQVKKIRMTVQLLTFGDGTGYAGNSGVLLPRQATEPSSLNRCLDPPNRSVPNAFGWGTDREANHPVVGYARPADFMPVDFLPTSTTKLPSPSVNTPQTCCADEGCARLIVSRAHACLHCPDQNRATPTLCSDNAGACWRTEFGSIECEIKNGEYFSCLTIDTTPCGGPPPTPTPTPMPTPTPSPTPADCSLSTRPNATNCRCEQVTNIGPLWFCGCEDNSEPANLNRFPQSGGCDPNKSFNNGGDCCTCINPTNCGAGFVFSNSRCECVRDLLAIPTPTPINGGGYLIGGCTQYYWVLYECTPVGEDDWDCQEIDRWPAFCV
jgi:hypothetical protein